MGSNTNSWPWGHDNYSHGCGYVDINVEGYDNEVFTGDAFNQHLSVFEGLATVKGNGITARVLAWNAKDVIATEIDDQRDNPSAINIDLRMLRYSLNYVKNENWKLKKMWATHHTTKHITKHTTKYGTMHALSYIRKHIKKVFLQREKACHDAREMFFMRKKSVSGASIHRLW